MPWVSVGWRYCRRRLLLSAGAGHASVEYTRPYRYPFLAPTQSYETKAYTPTSGQIVSIFEWRGGGGLGDSRLGKGTGGVRETWNDFSQGKGGPGGGLQPCGACSCFGTCGAIAKGRKRFSSIAQISSLTF